MNVSAKIRSDVGFYIGDICYVLDDRIYHGVWGDQHDLQTAHSRTRIRDLRWPSQERHTETAATSGATELSSPSMRA